LNAVSKITNFTIFSRLYAKTGNFYENGEQMSEFVRAENIHKGKEHLTIIYNLKLSKIALIRISFQENRQIKFKRLKEDPNKTKRIRNLWKLIKLRYSQERRWKPKKTINEAYEIYENYQI